MTARRPLFAALAFAALAGAGAAAAADVVALRNAWMRPAAAGAPSARAYVDIESAADLTLIEAATPVARRVEFVRVKVVGDPATEETVATMPVAAGKTTRLAFRGDHLRLTEITRDAGNGDPVPLTLTFRDGRGRLVKATTSVTVRGLLLPQQRPEAARGATTDAPAAGAPEPAPAMRM
ncbi:MAG: copper chaperone PCu(A)C [Burkholderiales bacterium]|nr:copper chaperone PCu(A)C [Burkholderiales bacterium]